MFFNFFKIADLIKFCDDVFKYILYFSVSIRRTCQICQKSFFINGKSIHRKIISYTYFIIYRIVCRSDLQCSCTKGHINCLVCNHRNRFIDDRYKYIFSDELLISLIMRTYRNCNICKDSLRTCGSNRDTVSFPLYEIFDIVEISFFFLVVYFKI